MRDYLQMRVRSQPIRRLRLYQLMIASAAFVAISIPSLGLMASQAEAQGVSLPWAQSQWVQAHGASARLVGGSLSLPDGKRRLMAGLEIRLGDDWKTYWRNPGDAGGVAPNFTWSGSQNLASARVLYPAPRRFTDASGQTIGYKHNVVLPVEVTPIDPARPVNLALKIEYGVCREICVPAEARLELTISPSNASVPQQLISALSAVPSPATQKTLHLKSATATLSGTLPHLTFDIDGVTGTGVDLFVEAAGNIYLPMTKRVDQPAQGVQRFSIDLRNVDDVKLLKGKKLRLTMTSPTQSVEQEWTVP